VEFCETRRAVSDRASGAENVNEVVKTMGGNISNEVKNAVDMTTRSEENKETVRIEEILRRMSCDKGWVAKEKCKIKEKTGKCERLLLKSNLGRRWIERIRKDGLVPRQIWDFINNFKTMVNDAEGNTGISAEE